MVSKNNLQSFLKLFFQKSNNISKKNYKNISSTYFFMEKRMVEFQWIIDGRLPRDNKKQNSEQNTFIHPLKNRRFGEFMFRSLSFKKVVFVLPSVFR